MKRKYSWIKIVLFKSQSLKYHVFQGNSIKINIRSTCGWLKVCPREMTNLWLVRLRSPWRWWRWRWRSGQVTVLPPRWLTRDTLFGRSEGGGPRSGYRTRLRPSPSPTSRGPPTRCHPCIRLGVAGGWWNSGGGGRAPSSNRRWHSGGGNPGRVVAVVSLGNGHHYGNGHIQRIPVGPMDLWKPLSICGV